MQTRSGDAKMRCGGEHATDEILAGVAQVLPLLPNVFGFRGSGFGFWGFRFGVWCLGFRV